MCGFVGIRKGNYFGGEPTGRDEVEVRVGKLKNGKVAGKNEIIDVSVLCGESEEDLRVMVGRFVEACRRRELKINAGKSKVMVLNR